MASCEGVMGASYGPGREGDCAKWSRSGSWIAVAADMLLRRRERASDVVVAVVVEMWSHTYGSFPDKDSERALANGGEHRGDFYIQTTHHYLP